MSLLDRTVGFTTALRAAGLPVSTAETVDAVRAMGTIELIERAQLRAALAASVCKKPAYRTTFDTLFDLWFPPRLGDGAAAELAGQEGDDTDATQPVSGDPAAMREALRDELTRLILDGDEDAIRRFAREAVGLLGRAETQPGRQSWFAYRVLRALSPDTLIAVLLKAMLGEQQRGGLAEKVARQTISDRIRVFEETVENEVRRRLAEERGVETIARTAVKPLTEQVEFLRASRQDLLELRRQVHPLARRLATRLTARRRLGRTGRLDFRRTVRASLATGGVPIVTKHRPHKPHKPELVVLCDVSGSVSSFAHFTLMLTHALREQFSKVRAFAFIDTTDEITDHLREADLGDVMSKIATHADLVWFDGHSDYGHAFERFAEKYPDAITPKTALLILGDARNNHRSPNLPVLRRLVKEARHTYWLNPEPRAYWGSGDSSAGSYADVVDEMVECRNVEQLADFVQRLLPT
jgi:uncharacterized protein with von Willebrand factor type A (vWA) domain